VCGTWWRHPGGEGWSGHAEHTKRTWAGMFYVFEGRGWDRDAPNIYSMLVWACYMCLVEGEAPNT